MPNLLDSVEETSGSCVPVHSGLKSADGLNRSRLAVEGNCKSRLPLLDGGLSNYYILRWYSTEFPLVSPEDQRTTTDVSFGSSYVLIWVAAVLFFVCSWMLLGTFCCWTRDVVDVESSEVSLRLPRLRPVSTGSSNPMLTAEH
ncbi:hypothetical protein AHF37_02306 [Paragonimus kellicotti]|nr:hypothetical protein AHF37_02306 [Paragonimus kellicotti]